MGGYLKQSTASQTRKLGAFVDDTDGKSPETTLTIVNTDIKISKNGGTYASKNSGGGTHDANGDYSVTYDATDTNTVGHLKVSCKMAGALIVEDEFWVLEEAIYDALFAASAAGFDASGRVDIGAINGVTNAAVQLAKSANQIVSGTVNTGITAASTTSFAAEDITEATAGHFNGRRIIFTSGALTLNNQATDITGYTLTSGEGVFTVTGLTEAPSDGDTFIIV